ncbi:MAG: transposase [Planctomycetia bacterium]|nr:transposase [Planctomycetia bacterium]
MVWRKDRSKESLDLFYQWLGAKKVKKLRLAVMDMWKAFEKSTSENAFHAAILYDKFHIMRHLGKRWKSAEDGICTAFR